MSSLREAVGHGVPIEDVYGYSGALKAKGLIHVSGQLSRNSTGQQVSGDFRKKIETVYDNMESLLSKYGLNLAHVIQLQLHISEPLPEVTHIVEEVHKRRLNPARPAMTIVQVAGLNDVDGTVEISGVASVVAPSWN